MEKKIIFLAFASGLAVGSVAIWYHVKNKYEKIAQEEIDSVKEYYAKNKDAKKTDIDCGEDCNPRPFEDAAQEKEVREYHKILEDAGYAASKEGGSHNAESAGPYVISPEEFSEFDDYEKISFTYYADGILADDNDEIIHDVEEAVGDALEHFGEYEDDSVFVRCDERQCDYEILLDQRDYHSITRPKQIKI